ncbi:unnamed protein product [Linum tenue]|uniref:cytokinin dehydrogenase n=1 Tax=Linum tenue TaxID=586396 RepID=A0AAV0GS34_9ROSI|nr:unnamed protein product [Linum tenue]
MASPTSQRTNKFTTLRLRFLMIMLLCHTPHESKLFSANQNHQKIFSPPPPPQQQQQDSNPHAAFDTLDLDGHFSFQNTAHASRDFGNRFFFRPAAVLHPKSVSDIASTVKHVYEMGPLSGLTVAARGHGHSLQGQSQADGGIVVNMESLTRRPSQGHLRGGGGGRYVDVSGGELWIDVLKETLKQGLAPKSWTDYLHLTVGGTLSNGGISGQAFRHGPQINNVQQLEVVTGKGEVVTCSEKQNAELFFSVLGGLGQFGIITRARISLEAAPDMVRWIRVLYSDFSKFSTDQEHLISLDESFDYIEGFVIINRTGLLNNWRSSFHPKDPVQASQFVSDGKTLYCLEVAKYYNSHHDDALLQQIQGLLSKLHFITSTLFVSEVSYLGFLDRVHVAEMKLREQGLWEVPHPWLCLFIPGSKMDQFASQVFGSIVTDSSNGPILIYALNQSKWNNNIKRTSLVTPREDVIYHVSFLASAVPSSTGKDGLDYILARNQRILDFSLGAGIGLKQYLPHYTTQEDWKGHFGSKWEVFLKRKLTYDPLAVLAPGHRIFKRQYQIRKQSITEGLLKNT